MKEGIPKNAKRVFQGILFDVWQWQQEMYDGTIQTFEMLSHADSATVIAGTDKQTILLLEEQQPGRADFISLPAGSMEPEEDLLECAKRELLEETGYESAEWEILTQTGFGSKFAYTNTIYIARSSKKTNEQRLDPGEKIKVREITFEEFLALKDNIDFRNKDILHILEKANADTEYRTVLRQKIFNSV
jgi:ADP-ribose pyrophosphatase